MSFLLPAVVLVMALFAILVLDYDTTRQPWRPGDVYGAAWVLGDGGVYGNPPPPLSGRVVTYRVPF